MAHRYSRNSRCCDDTLPLPAIWRRHRLLRASLLTVAVPVLAQTPTAASNANAANPADMLQLDEIVVTAASVAAPKMQQSLSVSTLDVAQIANTGAMNAVEILRAVPGIRAESTGGEGNANLTVRGLPLSAGGARYVQLQEDGLPLLQFGDIAFATADQFLRVDGSVQRIELVRGGSASTMATNSPGGVANYLSHDGSQQQGTLALSQGIGFTHNRYDFSYGQPLQSSNTRFFVAGFFRSGESARETDVTTENGGQLRANVTRAFDNGYLRASFKHLDDNVPMAMPVPVSTQDGRIRKLPGIDPRTASFYSPYWVKDQTVDRDNNLKRSDVNDGLHISSQSFGLEANFDLANDVVLEDRLRISNNDGRFIAVFPADNGYGGGGPFTYATGPQAGQPYNGNPFTATVFNVALDDLGNALNELKLSKTFSLFDERDLVTAVGLYQSLQNVALTWQFNQYLMAGDGSKPALVASPDTSLVTPGLLAAGSAVWDGCCTRNIDAEYTTTAPFASAVLTRDAWTFDIGVRQDRQQATGTYTLAQANVFEDIATQSIDYDVHKTSYSFGANWLLRDNIALFVRHSLGHAFNADRLMFNGFALDGTRSIPVNEVLQNEIGIKWRGDDLSLFVTVFDADTRDTNYEATTQSFMRRHYEARGAELEFAYVLGDFSVHGGATYTDATIRSAENLQFRDNTPRRQADVTFQLLPRYRLGIVDVGAAFIGSSDAYGDDANDIRLPGYVITNAFVDINIDDHTVLRLAANNIGDKLAYTEVEADGHAARAFDGRAVTAALSYTFF